VKIWVLKTGAELRTLRGHSNAVNSAAFSPDGKRIASASDDTTVKLWDVESGRELITLAAHNDFVFDVVWAPDGNTLFSAGADEIIQVYAMDIDLLMSVARGRVTRNLSAEECRKYLHVEDVPAIP
jgi:WD40 repeat protein